MKKSHLLTGILFCFLGFNSCFVEPSEEPFEEPFLNENFRFYPTDTSNVWHYRYIEQTGAGSKPDTTLLTAKYNPTDRRMDYFKNDKVLFNAFWFNQNNKLLCCGGLPLVDYDLIGCSEDSIIISERQISENGLASIYQYCGDKFVDNSLKYKDIKCLKTMQLNQESTKTTMKMVRYYGFEFGLIYEEQITYGQFKMITSIRTLELIDHEF